jgi:hypothetical protein
LAALWDVEDLVGYLKKPVSWIYDNHVREGIPSFRVGQQLRFLPDEVRKWLDVQAPRQRP